MMTTYRSTLVGAALTVSALLYAPETVRAGTWRCMDEPDSPACQDDLVNDIESMVNDEWPTPLRLSMPAIPYTCASTGTGGGGGRLAAERETGHFTARDLNWSIEFTGDLTSFLIGQHTVAARLFGTVTLPGSPLLRAKTWSGVDISYVYGESTGEVMTPSGPTGVIDLGWVQSTTAAGDFWSGSLPFEYNGIGSGGYRCTVGAPGKQITKSGRGSVRIDYPVAWIDVHAVVAEAVRERFRRAVRIVVTGEP